MGWKKIMTIIGICVTAAAVAGAAAVFLMRFLGDRREAAGYIECACDPEAY